MWCGSDLTSGAGSPPPTPHRPSVPAASNPTCCHQEDARGPCAWHSDSRGNAKASRHVPRSGQRPCGEPVGGRGPSTPCTGLQRADVKSRGGRPPGPGMRENAGQNWGGSAHTPQVARQHPRRLMTDPLLPPQSLKVMGRTSEATRKMPAGEWPCPAEAAVQRRAENTAGWGGSGRQGKDLAGEGGAEEGQGVRRRPRGSDGGSGAGDPGGSQGLKQPPTGNPPAQHPGAGAYRCRPSPSDPRASRPRACQGCRRPLCWGRLG